MTKPNQHFSTWSVLILVLMFQIKSMAAPILGKLIEVSQPDGTNVPVTIWGDEYYNWYESTDGYTLVKDEKGWLNYALLSSKGDDLTSSGWVYTGLTIEKARALSPNAPELQKKINISPQLIHQTRKEKRALGEVKASSSNKRLAEYTEVTMGDIKGLTILIDFPGSTSNITVAEVNDLFNKQGYTGYGNNGSVHDFFYDVSNGKVNYTTTTLGYYHALHPKSYYEAPDKNKELFQEAYTWADARFDFSTLTTENGKVKAINMIYAGYAIPKTGLWPHKGSFTFKADGATTFEYQITDIGYNLTIGTICHENGHMLFHWPDLYDGDEIVGTSAGLGDHCLMAYGNYGGGGKNPIPPNPYLKISSGWETPTLLTNASTGVKSINANSFAPYQFGEGFGPEFFLIEARTKIGRNAYLPDEGLMVWHIEEFGNNGREDRSLENHYMVSLLQADGRFDLEENNNHGDADDYFKAGKNDKLNDYTHPSAKWFGDKPSGLVLSHISAVGSVMTFEIGNTYDLTDLPNALLTSQYQDSPSDEGLEQVIDNVASTKYLTHHKQAWLKFELPGTAFKVNKYSITSAYDLDIRDPHNWTFSGSNDGVNWTVLDTRTGIDFPNRLQRIEFSFTNSVSYAYFKLDMESEDQGNILQLAELEIFGKANAAPSVNILLPLPNTAFTAGTSITIQSNRSDVDGSVKRIRYFANGLLIGQSTTAPFTVTWANPPVGLHSIQAIATDNDSASSSSESVQVSVNSIAPLVDLTETPGILTVQYDDSPEGEGYTKLIDNSSASKYFTFNSSAWIQYKTATPTKLSKYSITSANDEENRDPANWLLKASNDGVNWTTLEIKSGEDFPNRLQRKEYPITNSLSYQYYRLELTSESSDHLQLSEIELLGIPVLNDITNYGGTITTQYPDSNSGERVTNLIDNEVRTKLFSAHAPIWVKFHQPIASIVSEYTITSANDSPDRDPSNWILKGSLDGIQWTILDTRTNETFTERYQKKYYSFTNSMAYKYYQLDIQPNGGWTQFAELELIGTGGGTLQNNVLAPSSNQNQVVLSLQDEEYKRGMKAWWNENDKVLRVELATESITEGTHFSLYSLTGINNIPNSIRSQGNQALIETSHLHPAIYILTVQTETQVYKKSIWIGTTK